MLVNNVKIRSEVNNVNGENNVDHVVTQGQIGNDAIDAIATQYVGIKFVDKLNNDAKIEVSGRNSIKDNDGKTEFNVDDKDDDPKESDKEDIKELVSKQELGWKCKELDKPEYSLNEIFNMDEIEDQIEIAFSTKEMNIEDNECSQFLSY